MHAYPVSIGNPKDFVTSLESGEEVREFVSTLMKTHPPNELGMRLKPRFVDTHYWVAPDSDYLGMIKQIKLVVRGHGGEIDHSWLYLDHNGAANWLTIFKNTEYLNSREGLPFGEAANTIALHVKEAGYKSKDIHLIGLGCGDGQREIHLVNSILARLPEAKVHLYFLDISPALLNFAFQNASLAFGHKANVSITGIQGNFENLSSYEPIIRIAKESNELVILPMFGYTFGNLRHERMFVRNALRVFPKNTLFLIDALLTMIPASDKEKIEKTDPRLSGKGKWTASPEELEFLLSPIKQYRSDVNMKNIVVSQGLDYSTCFDGSYAVEIRALVDGKVPFTLMRVKRYEPTKLAEMFQAEGWDPLSGFRYGLGTNPRMLYMLSKTHPAV